MSLLVSSRTRRWWTADPDRRAHAARPRRRDRGRSAGELLVKGRAQPVERLRGARRLGRHGARVDERRGRRRRAGAARRLIRRSGRAPRRDLRPRAIARRTTSSVAAMTAGGLRQLREAELGEAAHEPALVHPEAELAQRRAAVQRPHDGGRVGVEVGGELDAVAEPQARSESAASRSDPVARSWSARRPAPSSAGRRPAGRGREPRTSAPGGSRPACGMPSGTPLARIVPLMSRRCMITAP